MQLLKLVLAVAVLGYGYHAWHVHKNGDATLATTSARSAPGSSGFMPVAMPEGSSRNTVLILAPINCPSSDAKRADVLAESLTRRGIPNIRSSSYSLRIANPSEAEQANMKRAGDVLGGGIPAVFVNGMGKSNPSIDEVAAEYARTR